LVAGGFATEDQKAVARDLIAKYSPTGKVPVLLDPALGDDVPIYDSLAILIYLDGKYPEAKLLPEDGRARAQCLSAVCEMHSGFVGMRSNMPLNCVRRGYSHGARALAKPEVQADVQRLNELWGDLRGEYSASGPYLFGAFSAADCAFAPVALRFVTYDQDLSSLTPMARDYVRAIQRNAYVCEWIAGADAEGPETKIGGYEALCDAR
jgi:glutathione S-transferase